MNLTRNPALIEQLAASYALGTLRGGARRRFEALARTHASVRAAALIWQGRLASVTELQPQEAPSPAVWKRIENLVQADKQARAMQAARQAPRASAGGWWASLGLWRGASAAGAMAAVAAVVVGVNLNTQLNGQVRELSARLAATPEIQYVAVLADDKAAASMLVTFDPKNNRLVLKRVGGFQESADKSLELWALPQAGGPKSLGVLGSEKVIRLTASDTDVREVPALAITLEPKGGVPPGSGPTGPILFKGALIQTTL
ncbi:anti-sigma factor domain-containing protein [Polaromonas sp. A23]|uniref:anti-sigma factor n=1 Tax=Polaromonas sp. A23 TaxID=1944133 RepID=UPI0009867C6C|nr:anti-sigma factor [Polaromonas sp. A23]OOG36644.1 RNA polymerase subunit sigma-70 [Polaromonas sp. A23]